MTLIAFAASKNRADILTDTWAYTHNGRHIARSSKVRPIPHLDMACATQGDSEFGALWDLGVAPLALQAATFDDFVQMAIPHIRGAWDAADPQTRTPSVVFLIGYSHEANRFRAYHFASEQDFDLVELDAPFIMPTPLGMRPSEMELARTKADFAGADDEAEVLRYLETWHRKPAPVAPSTVKGWVQLGKHIREGRALIHAATRMKVFVAGDLHHSVLQRGEFRTTRVHTFNDSGAEFAQLVAGTLHPISQNGPCLCGSGNPFMDCCLTSDPTVACTCGSGEPFLACCSVRADTAPTPPTAQLTPLCLTP